MGWAGETLNLGMGYGLGMVFKPGFLAFLNDTHSVLFNLYSGVLGMGSINLVSCNT